MGILAIDHWRLDDGHQIRGKQGIDRFVIDVVFQ